MYPHERSLVKKLADKPFALVGVNSDRDLDELKKVLQEEQITWRSFKNDKGGSGDPISTDWNVQGWPTLYIIDHKGVIRHKYEGIPGNDKLDAAIDTLIEAAEKETPPKK
jgi:Thioredoxin-like